MNIAGLSMNLSKISLQSQVGTAVLSKAMDTNELLGEQMVKMIDSAALEQSINPGVGANIDIRL